MGVRGEIYSNKVSLPNRTYFFNVKENRMGDLYLNIVESKNRDSGGFDRQSVILFADDLQEFLKGFDESLKVMEKAIREKRQSGSVKAAGARSSGEEKSSGGKARSDERDKKPNREFNSRERSRSGERGNNRGERKFNRSSERRNDRGGARETSFKKREGEFKKRGGDRNRGREHSDDRGFEQKRAKRVVVKKKF